MSEPSPNSTTTASPSEGVVNTSVKETAQTVQSRSSDTPINSVVVTMRIDSDSLRRRVRERLFRAIDYITIFMFVLTVYGAALFADNLLFSFMWILLNADIQKYPIVSMVFDYTKIGLAILFIFGGVIHAVISTYSQVKLDIELSREGQKSK